MMNFRHSTGLLRSITVRESTTAQTASSRESV
ncbi:hypothetical protein RSAG8_07559, partial [Rhizoctonia solani AG-8 WAC10335]